MILTGAENRLGSLRFVRLLKPALMGWLCYLPAACSGGGASAVASTFPAAVATQAASAPGGSLATTASAPPLGSSPGISAAAGLPASSKTPMPANAPAAAFSPIPHSFVAPVSVASPQAGEPRSVGAVKVNATFVLGVGASSSAERALKYISPSNTRITVAVTAIGGGTTMFGPTACTTGSCVISFTANPGPNILAFTLTDGAAHLLSSFTTTQIIAPVALTTLKFSANPVVNSVAVTLAAATTNAGTAFNDTLTVNAYDKDANIIVGTSNYIDASGNPLVLTLSTVNTQSGGRGTVTIRGIPRITNPNQTAITAYYDGGWLDHSSIVVTPSSALAGGVSGATLTTVPYAQEYPTTGCPIGITSGSDGNLWYTDCGSALVGRISVQGTGLTTYSCGCTHLQYIRTAADGKFWISDLFGGGVYTMPAIGGAFTSIGGFGMADVVLPRADGKIWISSRANGINVYTTLGVLVNSFLTSDVITGIAFTPDGHLWYCDVSTGNIGVMTDQGVVLATYPLTNLGGSGDDGLVYGPDGNLWVANEGGSVVERVTLGGVVTDYSLLPGAGPTNILVGPDGALWFGETGSNTIGRITTAGVLQEFGTGNGVSGSSGSYGMTVGPDGNIWFTESGNSAVGKIVL